MVDIQKKEGTAALLTRKFGFIDHYNIYLDTLIVILGDLGGEIPANMGFPYGDHLKNPRWPPYKGNKSLLLFLVVKMYSLTMEMYI